VVLELHLLEEAMERREVSAYRGSMASSRLGRASASLEGVRIKLHRADHHICEVDRLVRPVVEAATRSIVRMNDGDATRLVYTVARAPLIDPAGSAVVGDALFNLRSAFDHLAWQLIQLDGGVPDQSTQFPIRASRTDTKGRPTNITVQPGIRRVDILQALDAAQPYHRDEKWDSQLWVVNELCNVDKHRLLLTMAGVLNFDNKPPFWGLYNGASPSYWFNVFKPLSDGDAVARFDFKGTEAPAEFDPHISLAVTLDEGPPAHWMRL
jgi:hypothetical protein